MQHVASNSLNTQYIDNNVFFEAFHSFFLRFPQKLIIEFSIFYLISYKLSLTSYMTNKQLEIFRVLKIVVF